MDLKRLNKAVEKKLTRMSDGYDKEKSVKYKGYTIDVYDWEGGKVAIFANDREVQGKTVDDAIAKAKAAIDKMK